MCTNAARKVWNRERDRESSRLRRSVYEQSVRRGRGREGVSVDRAVVAAAFPMRPCTVLYQSPYRRSDYPG